MAQKETEIICNDFYIKTNTPGLRKTLLDLGYDVCPCCEFKGWNWLHVGEYGVHGISTVFDEEIGFIQSELFEQENSSFNCGTDLNLFIEMAVKNKR